MRNVHTRIKLAAAVLAAAPAVLAPQAQAQLASLPLPVTTNVTVTNPSIPVTGSVSVSGGSVSLGNSTVNVHSVDNQALNAFAKTYFGSCGSGTASVGISAPGGATAQLLVLEMVSVTFYMPVGFAPHYGVQLSAATGDPQTGNPYGLYIPATLAGSDGSFNLYVATQAVKAYSGGNSINFSVTAVDPAGYTGVAPRVCIDNVSISGYMVPNH